jgi:hypothetical protein
MGGAQPDPSKGGRGRGAQRGLPILSIRSLFSTSSARGDGVGSVKDQAAAETLCRASLRWWAAPELRLQPVFQAEVGVGFGMAEELHDGREECDRRDLMA